MEITTEIERGIPVNISILGIDIAKAKFDVALITNDKMKAKVFENNTEGFIALAAWLLTHLVQKVHACMEATGVYHEALAEYLADAGHTVSVVNPAQIAAYAKTQLQRGKTDIQDARIIARYCEREQPAPWQPAPMLQRQLLQWARQLQHLNDCLQAEQCRLQTAAPAIGASIEKSIAFHHEEIKRVEKLIKEHVRGDPTLKNNKALLLSIPGIGDKTSIWLLAYLGDGQKFTRGKQAAAYAGLSPRPWQSGSSVSGPCHISKVGQSDLRKALYMPATSTYGHGWGFVAFVNRLKAAGKAPMSIIVALMRKMISVAQAVLRAQTAFNPALHSQ